MNPKARNPIKDTRGKKTRWRAVYSITVDGETVRKYAGIYDTKSEAKRQTELKVAEIIRISDNQLVETELTVEKFMDQEWLDHRKTQISAMHQTVMFVKLIRMNSFGQIAINKVNAVALTRFWLDVEEYIKAKGYKQGSVNKLRGNMNSLLDFAVQKAYLEVNENFGLRVRSARADKKQRGEDAEELWEKAQKIWTVDQIHEYLPLLKTMDKKPKYVDGIMWWAFFSIGIYTGLRRGEIIGLKFSDFDRENRILKVRRNISMNDDRELVENKPKKSSFGRIKYTEELDEVLDALDMYHLVNGTLKNEYLIQYKLGGLITPEYWTRMWKRVQIQAGIPKDQVLPSSHYMRHTHLSLLAYLGFSMTEIQKRARHKDPRTTAKYYVHILDERDEQMAESFSRAIKDKQRSED